MPDTWQNIPKSAIDDETIEEAIARIIEEHNDDSEAHLGVGQSLNSHKASEIIDHLAKSIVMDKFSASEKTLITVFNSYDQFDSDSFGGTAEIIGPELNLISGSTLNQWVKIRSFSDVIEVLDFEKNPFFETAVFFASFENIESYFSFGLPEVDESNSAFGFRVHSNKLYGFIFNDPDFSEIEITGVTPNVLNVYLAVINSTTKVIDFYVNGILKETLSFSSFPNKSYVSYYYYIKTLQASSKRLVVRNVKISTD